MLWDFFQFVSNFNAVKFKRCHCNMFFFQFIPFCIEDICHCYTSIIVLPILIMVTSWAYCIPTKLFLNKYFKSWLFPFLSTINVVSFNIYIYICHILYVLMFYPDACMNVPTFYMLNAGLPPGSLQT